MNYCRLKNKCSILMMVMMISVLLHGCQGSDIPFKEILKKLGFNVSDNSKSAIPASRDVQVHANYNKLKYEWLHRHFVKWYRDSTAGSGGYSEDAAGFLDDYCLYKAECTGKQNYNSLLQKAEGLAGNPSCPAIVRFCHAKLLQRDKQNDRAEKILRELSEEMLASGHPRIHSYFVNLAMKEILSERMTGIFTEKNEYEKKSADALLKAIISGEFADSEMRIAFEMANCKFIDDNLVIIINGLKAFERKDPWLLGMIEGIYHIDRAWRWRGSGWAKEVTDDGNREFHNFLEKAEISLERAYELRPDRPEAAACMITVAMGNGGKPGKSERFWFDRAVAAEMDYMPAYASYLWSIRPRWGGSHRKMTDFAEECLATGRCDTDVPFMYLTALRDIGKEARHNRWKAVFRNGRVEKNLSILFDGMMHEPARKQDAERIAAQRANVLLWQGRYDEAGKILSSLGSNYDMTDGFNQKALSWSGRSMKTLMTEVELFTGEHADLMKQAEKHNLDGGDDNVMKACNLYRQVMDYNRNKPQAYRFLQELIVSTMNDSIDFAFYEDQALLYIVAQRDRPDIAGFLVETGANVNSEEKKSKKTPLHAAASAGNTETCALLLENGADINRKDYGGNTPLSLALEDHRHETAMLLLDKGADGNTVNLNRWTPLHLAVHGRHQEVAARLIRMGVDINSANDQGWTPLCLALRYEQPDIARLLLEKGAAIEGQDKGLVPLNLAIANNHDELAAELIKRGVNINIVDMNGATPIQIAIETKKADLLKLMTGKDIDLNFPANDQLTPLHHSYHSFPETAPIPINKGANPHAEAKDGWSPAEIAVWNNHTDDAMKLINNGADIKKICTIKKATLLHMAAFKNQKDVVRLLLEKGADTDAKDEDGNTPFDIAQKYNSSEAARIILEHLEKKEFGINMK